MIAPVSLLYIGTAAWTLHSGSTNLGKTCFLLLLFDVSYFFISFLFFPQQTPVIIFTSFTGVEGHIVDCANQKATSATTEYVPFYHSVLDLA
jgi:hypothetical protein